MWEKLHKSIKMLPPYGKAFAAVKDADLDKAEKAIGSKLPESYREYAKLFGYGEHGKYFRIYVPLGSKYPNADLTGHTLSYRKDCAELADKKKDKEFYLRMIPFADTSGGDIFAFDPAEAKGKDAPDYAVYVIIHGRDKIEKLSPDFKTFFTDVVYGTGLEKVLKNKEKLVVLKEFQPFGDKVRGL